MTKSIPTKPKYDTRRLAINIIEDDYEPTVMLPPLYFHINPQNFDIAYAKKIHRYQTFTATVEEYWGDELDVITCSASTGAFLSEDFGLDTVTRSKTNPYFKFQDVLDVYRNNGNIYSSDGRVIRKGKVVMFFDPGTYFGYFENFSYTESATSPFRFVFNFTFKVQKSFTGI
jgi:hypothetical protein